MTDNALASSVLVALVEAGYARVHIHPAGLNLPVKLQQQNSVMLQLENNFADFGVGAHGWWVTLLLPNASYVLQVPWSQTQAILNRDVKGLVQTPVGWNIHGTPPEGLAPDLATVTAAPVLTPEQRRKTFRVINGGKAPARTPRKPPPEEWGEDDGKPVSEDA